MCERVPGEAWLCDGDVWGPAACGVRAELLFDSRAVDDAAAAAEVGGEGTVEQTTAAGSTSSTETEDAMSRAAGVTVREGQVNSHKKKTLFGPPFFFFFKKKN